jgi:hypothetical protein
MDEKRKAELRGLCERASKAPWYWIKDTLCADRDFPVVLKATLENEKEAGLFVHGCDKEFITAARTALPELLDDNDAKDREIERLNARVEVLARGKRNLEKELYSKHNDTYYASTR